MKLIICTALLSGLVGIAVVYSAPSNPRPEDSNDLIDSYGPESESEFGPIDLNNPEFQRPDMLLTEEQQRMFDEARSGIDFTKYPGNKWPNATVYYRLSTSYTSADVSKIMTGFQMIQNFTCIRFVRRTTQADFVDIKSTGNGCYSYLGKVGGAQEYSIDSNCPAGTVAHESMHALGVAHHHARYDRDDYVTINWQNIPESWREQYVKVNASQFFNYNSAYDYGSIMHYPAQAPGSSLNAITAKVSGGESKMGQRSRLAQTDINILKAMYC